MTSDPSTRTRASRGAPRSPASAGCSWPALGAGAASPAPPTARRARPRSRGLVSCVLTPELTEGPVLHPRREGAPEHHRGQARRAARAPPRRARRVDVPRPRGGDGRYLALRRRRHLLGLHRAPSTGGRRAAGAAPTDKRTFLRGIQPTNAQGVATFQTIYPGWYRGRAVHIHVKVHLGGNVVHTGQLFFSDALTDTVYKRSPVQRRARTATRGTRTTRSTRTAAASRCSRWQKSGAGYVGRVTMGVHRT